ncbi:MAG: phenylacetic acid degradation protein PaaN [Gammaproteobacteria bacterium]|nr:phenylacetic acid degradation protein PaaN [Gammaproteobacteria bacterium]
MTRAAEYFAKHQALLDSAREACRTRGWFSPFPETLDKYPDAVTARATGQAAFEAQLGHDFELPQPGVTKRIGIEVSPYTQELLGIRYPLAEVDALFEAARRAIPRWRDAGPHQRVGVCLEITDRLYRRMFELAYAVMHTTGQSVAMSYAGSGTNALDRGLEALAYAWDAMAAVPEEALWSRQFGSTTINLKKRFRLEPRGVAICFCCATFPTWNALPSIYANLATGNAVIVKPHPTCVLPMALIVRECRDVLAEAGFDANLVTLAIDTPDAPLGKRLVKHPSAAIIDFTGSAQFGRWIECNAHPALCFTETSGVNTVVIDSMDELAPVARSLATTLSLFSAQMCTSPQNLYVPVHGMSAGAAPLSVDDFTGALIEQMNNIAGDAKRAAAVLATLQAGSTATLIDRVTEQGRRAGRILRESAPYAHPEYPQARTRSPVVIQLDPQHREMYAEERFGPIVFVIPVASREEALARATDDVRHAGGITAFAYSRDPEFVERVENAYAEVGANLTCNLIGPMPLNFAAAYSDFHVSGLNPAGNATLTAPSFVASRFRVVQSRSPEGPRTP